MSLISLTIGLFWCYRRGRVVAPEISVLLPAFDAASTLAAALRSVQRQTEQRWECVVVDDGSRDATLELAQTMAREDERIRVVARPHAGIVSALRAGIAECKAPLIARMDADDLMSRRRLELQSRALAEAYVSPRFRRNHAKPSRPVE